MLYRILTEHKASTIKKLCSIVAGRFKSFTVIYGDGYWRGNPEKTVIFEIDSECDTGLVRNLAADIREVNQQECVMVQVVSNTFTYMVSGDINGEPPKRKEVRFQKGLAP